VLVPAGIALGFSMGLGTQESVFTGLLAGAVSTAETVELMERRAERGLVHSRISEVSSLGEDLFAVAALGFLSSQVFGALTAVALSIGFLGVRGRFDRLISGISDSEQVEVFLGVSLLLLSVVLSSELEAGAAAGALAAGLLISRYPEDVEILESLKPLETFFSAVFFVSIGASVDPTPFAALVGSVLAVFVSVVGPALSFASLRLRGRNLHQSFLAALELGSVSEVVLLGGLLVLGTGSPVLSASVVAALGASAVSSYTSRRSSRIYSYLVEYFGSVEREGIDASDHTVVLGYGEMGASVAEALENPVVIDNDPRRHEKAGQNYRSVFGDARDPSVWEAVSIDRAEKVISTVDKDSVAELVAEKSGSSQCFVLTGTAAKARELETEVAATEEQLSADRAAEVLEEGLDNGFSDLRSKLRNRLSDTT
jgi:Kef-type K+ transport systems, membrane components